MTERDEDAVEILHRMVEYIRAEARRLDALDVALLLEHAADIIVPSNVDAIYAGLDPSRGPRDH